MSWFTSCDIYRAGLRDGLKKAGDLLLEELYSMPEEPPHTLIALVESMANMLEKESEHV